MADLDDDVADWQRRVVGRSLRTAKQRSIDRGASLIAAAGVLLERSKGDSFTVQDVADEAGQSLRTLYQYFESKDDLLLAVFEEAMHAYAALIEAAIAPLDDPLDRLAGGIIAAAVMPTRAGGDVQYGLARLRLRLGQVEPELLARSHRPLTSMVVRLIDAAAADGSVPPCDTETMAFQLTALNTSFLISQTLGNDYGLTLPDPIGLAAFCLGGLRAEHADLKGLRKRLDLPKATKASAAKALGRRAAAAR